MRNGKSAALKKISANVKTWDMMKKLTHTPAMPGNFFPRFISGNRKVKVDMRQKRPFMSAKIAAAVPVKKFFGKATGIL